MRNIVELGGHLYLFVLLEQKIDIWDTFSHGALSSIFCKILYLIYNWRLSWYQNQNCSNAIHISSLKWMVWSQILIQNVMICKARHCFNIWYEIWSNSYPKTTTALLKMILKDVFLAIVFTVFKSHACHSQWLNGSEHNSIVLWYMVRKDISKQY